MKQKKKLRKAIIMTDRSVYPGCVHFLDAGDPVLVSDKPGLSSNGLGFIEVFGKGHSQIVETCELWYLD